jgi:predicted ATPase/class 3 adenylate cyclase
MPQSRGRQKRRARLIHGRAGATPCADDGPRRRRNHETDLGGCSITRSGVRLTQHASRVEGACEPRVGGVVSELERWLENLGLSRYSASLEAHGVDLEALGTLTEQDLCSLGLPFGHRRKVLDALRTQPPKLRNSVAERRQLTVLFCDLPGSTELAARLDPEDMAVVLHAFQDACARVMRSWDGYVARSTGDGISAYFGFPMAREHAAERAIRAGRDLVNVVARLKPLPGVTLAARVGIETGLVVIGDPIGKGAACRCSAVGETPHAAAHLQGLAAAGTVVIGEQTRALVGDLFDLVDLGGHRAETMARPLRVWQVLGERRIDSRFEAMRGADPTPLVGRSREIEHLLKQFDAANGGRGRVVLMIGESGIGKSRILRVLRERLRHRPHTRLNHYCSPFARDSTLYPVVRLLERAAQIAPEQSSEEQLDRLEGLLAARIADVAGTAALFADLLGIPTGDRYLVRRLDPPHRMRMTLDALFDQLVAYAAEQPVLAVYEDVHWIDPSTRELLKRMVYAAATLRVLVVVTARPEFIPACDGLPHVSTLHLNRLGRSESETLIDHMTASRSLPPAVLARIVDQADGVPLYIEELTKAVLDSGALQDHGTHYHLVGALPLAIPTTVQDSLMALLDHLGADKEIAQLAAVIGREFSARLLARVAALDQPTLEATLGRLVASRILVRHGTRGDPRYGFRHTLIQEAAYASLLKSRRREIHARVVEVLATEFADLVAQRPEALAYHAARAGLLQQAVVHWHRAGQRALARSATSEAIQHLRHALEQVEALPKGRHSTATELEIQLKLGSALVASEGYAAPDMGRAYDRARELCEQLGPTPRLFPVLWGQSVHRTLRAELDQAFGIAREFHRLAVRDGNPAAIQVAERILGSNQLWLGQPRTARQHLERALEAHDPDARGELALDYSTDPRVVARCHLSLGLFVLGELEQAERESQRAISVAVQLQQVYGHAHAVMCACNLALLRRDAAKVEVLADILDDVAMRHDYRYPAAIAQMARGWVRTTGDAPKDGIAPLVQGLGAYQATGARLFIPLFLSLLAEAQQRTGQDVEARHHAYAALEQAEETGERWLLAELHRLIARLLLAESDRGDRHAEAHLRKALDIARVQGARMWELRAAVDLAHLQRRRGRAEAPVDLLAPLISWFGGRGVLAEFDQARTLLEVPSDAPSYFDRT